MSESEGFDFDLGMETGKEQPMADEVKKPAEVYRQGDVAFIRSNNVINFDNPPKHPWGATMNLKKLDTRVIRKGENGGIHALEEKAAEKDVVFYELGGTRYILSPQGVGIVHGEHHKIELPPGLWEVRVQNETTGWVND